jgi:hypothetical protein
LFFGRLLHFCGAPVAYPLGVLAFVPFSREGGVFGLFHGLVYAASYHWTGRLAVPCVLHVLEVFVATYFTDLIESFLELPLPGDTGNGCNCSPYPHELVVTAGIICR